MTRIASLSAQRDALGECPLWDEQRQSLFWIDGHRQQVFQCEWPSRVQRSWPAPQHIGSIALCTNGQLLLALEDGFALLDPDTGHLAPWGPGITHGQAQMRLNDGRVDRHGHFMVGSLVRGAGEPLGQLYQVSGNGQLETIDSGVRVSNALCSSPAGDILYFADSMVGDIWQYRYDSAIGQWGPRALFISKASLGSNPDGATVDAEGHLWVALVLVGKLVRINPQGQVVRSIAFAPDSYITCPTFGGRDLDILFLTSISDSGNALKSNNPDAGSVYVVEDLGVRGLPEARFDPALDAA